MTEEEGENVTNERAEEDVEAQFTPALFNLFSRPMKEGGKRRKTTTTTTTTTKKKPKRGESCCYRGSIKLLRKDYGGKPLFVLEPPPIIPVVRKGMLAFTHFRPFTPAAEWGSVATSARAASELLTGSPLPNPKLILATDPEQRRYDACKLVDPALLRVVKGESLDGTLFLLCLWGASGKEEVQSKTWERFGTLMRCESFLSPVQDFLCGGPRIEPCGPPLLIANYDLEEEVDDPEADEEGMVSWFRLWGKLGKPMRESELACTLAGWMALEERGWKTGLLLETGRSEDEAGCSVCGRLSSEDHGGCDQIYCKLLEGYLESEEEGDSR